MFPKFISLTYTYVPTRTCATVVYMVIYNDCVGQEHFRCCCCCSDKNGIFITFNMLKRTVISIAVWVRVCVRMCPRVYVYAIPLQRIIINHVCVAATLLFAAAAGQIFHCYSRDFCHSFLRSLSLSLFYFFSAIWLMNRHVN